MVKLLHPKYGLCLVLLIFVCAINKSETFQLRDLSASGGEEANTVSVKTPPAAGHKFAFRKLETKKAINFDDNDETDIDAKFEKVRKPTFEVTKRNLRPSVLKRSTNDQDSDSSVEDDDDDQGESFFSRVASFFTRDKKDIEEIAEIDEVDAETDDGSGEDSDQEEKQSFFAGISNKLRNLFGAKKPEVLEIEDENSGDESGDESDDDNDHSENDELETPKVTLKEKLASVFDRKPFNLIFDFDGSDTDDEDDDGADDELDDINYKKLKQEEQPEIEEEVEEEDLEIIPVKKFEKKVVEKIVAKVKETPKPITPARKESQKKEPKEKLSIAPDDFDRLLHNLPSFIPDYANVQSMECRRQGEIFQRQLRGQKIWALQMMDANAKIPSGLLRGNTNQLGDFDLCTRIAQKIKLSQSSSVKMKGKYCLANIDVVAAVDELKLPVHLMQGRNFLRSTINDPNHFLPRYSTINWGLCLPSACTFKDAEKVLKSFIGPYNSTGIKLHIQVKEDSCHIRHYQNWMTILKSNWKIFGTSLLLLFILAVTITASLNDYWELLCLNSIFKAKPVETETGAETETESEEVVAKPVTESKPSIPINNSLVNKLLMSFSLKKTLPALVGLNKDENEITCIHGLKAIAICLLFVSLKLIPMGRVPYSNRNKLTEFFNSPLSVFLRSSFLYEDVFFVISGFFAAYNMLKEIEKHGKILWTRRIFGRFLRLTPQLLIVLLFYSWIWENMGNGPQWGDIVSENADLCKQSMWKNVFFVQNLFPFEKMCASHTYHLAIEMQLFLFAPMLIWLFYKNPTYGLGAYGALHALSTAARFSSTLDNRLSVVIFHGMKLSQIYRTANLSFAVALHRATPYLVGGGLAVLIIEYGKVKLPRATVISGWLSTLIGFIWCFWSPSHLSHKDYQYEPLPSAQYAALAPLVWSLGIAWIIFACYTDHSWKLNWLLGTKPMIFLSNISYSVFLIIFLVFFYFSGVSRSGEEFHLSSYLDRLEIFLVIAIATIFTVMIDLPCQTIKNILTYKDEVDSIETVPNEQEEVKEEAAEIEVDFFADRDEDYRPKITNVTSTATLPEQDFYFKSKNYEDSETESTRNYENDGYEPKYRSSGTEQQDDDENEEESEEEIEEAEEIVKKPDIQMNARRWRWEVLDD